MSLECLEGTNLHFVLKFMAANFTRRWLIYWPLWPDSPSLNQPGRGQEMSLSFLQKQRAWLDGSAAFCFWTQEHHLDLDMLNC